MKKVLFVCVHNSARSQMAEAFLNFLAPDRFKAQSAGLKPGKLNPLVVEAMREMGIDISHHKTKRIEEVLQKNQIFDYVITVCDETSAEQCPSLPGKVKWLHWSFHDPSEFTGSHDEKLKLTKNVRDQIKSQIAHWLNIH